MLKPNPGRQAEDLLEKLGLCAILAGGTLTFLTLAYTNLKEQLLYLADKIFWVAAAAFAAIIILNIKKRKEK